MIDKQELIKVFSEISSIQLLTSGTCYNNCSYCCVHNKSNEAYIELDKKVVEAWRTGEYIKTACNVLQKLNVNNDKIRSIGLGSVEPSMHIEEVIPNLETILTTFPNLTNVFTASNFLHNSSKFNVFLKALDETAKKVDRRIRFYILMSIDGTDSLSLCGHRGTISLYKKHIDELVTFINNENFSNIDRISIGIHPTVDKDTYLNYFSEEKNIIDYAYFVDDMGTFIYNKRSNDILGFSVEWPSIATPYKFTTEESVRLKQIYDLWNRVKFKISTSKDSHILSYDFYANLNEGKIFYLTSKFKYFGYVCKAGTLNQAFITPDGTLIDCLDDLITSEELYKDTMYDIDKNEYYVANTYNSYLLNPLKDSDDTQVNKLWAFYIGMHCTDKIRLNLASGLMDELALSGQIPFEYFSNQRKKLLGIEYLGTPSGGECPRDCVSITKLFQCPYAGVVRMDLNAKYPYLVENNSRHHNPLMEFNSYIKRRVKK